MESHQSACYFRRAARAVNVLLFNKKGCPLAVRVLLLLILVRTQW